MFCEKKNLSVRRKKEIFKVWRGEKKCKCRISGVRKKKEIERKKNSEKKIRVFIFFGENFAKFVFTGWVGFSVKRKCFSSSKKSFGCVLPR